MTTLNLGPEDLLRDGQMKAVETDEGKFLLVRTDGRYYLTGCKCSHAGASLDQGLLVDKRIVCPWHHATFSVEDGSVLEPPALDGIKHFEARIEDGQILVDIPDVQKKESAAVETTGDETYVIIGGGAAGVMAADAVRQAGFKGRVVVLSDDSRPPYDRTMLSKSYLVEQDPNGYLPIHDEAFYESNAIELRLGTRVKRLSAKEREIELEDGETIAYTKALVASGSAVRHLDVKGADLEGVFALRNVDDAEALFQALRGVERAVVVGSGFIGLECASILRQRDIEVTVVSVESEPMERVLGADVGAILRGMHETNGVEFRMETGVVRYEGDGRVERVVIGDATELAADLVIEGVGVRPATDFLEGVEKRDDGGIAVDEQMCVPSTDGTLYAAGDVAAFPFQDFGAIRIEHWRTSQQTGRLAGFAMAGKPRPLEIAPFFWTRQYGRSLQYVGYAREWDDVTIHGEPQKKQFVAYYTKGDRILAAVGLKNDEAMLGFAECLRTGKLPPASALEDGPVDWLAQLR